jgi:hypothetical protein
MPPQYHTSPAQPQSMVPTPNPATWPMDAARAAHLLRDRRLGGGLAHSSPGAPASVQPGQAHLLLQGAGIQASRGQALRRSLLLEDSVWSMQPAAQAVRCWQGTEAALPEAFTTKATCKSNNHKGR